LKASFPLGYTYAYACAYARTYVSDTDIGRKRSFSIFFPVLVGSCALACYFYTYNLVSLLGVPALRDNKVAVAGRPGALSSSCLRLLVEFVSESGSELEPEDSVVLTEVLQRELRLALELPCRHLSPRSPPPTTGATRSRLTKRAI
jgi:hypothetical protein